MRNSQGIAILVALVLVILSQTTGQRLPAIRMAAADIMIEKQPVESNILSTEPAHPDSGRIEVAPVPPLSSDLPLTDAVAPEPLPESKTPADDTSQIEVVTPEPPPQLQTRDYLPQTDMVATQVLIAVDVPLPATSPDEGPLWELYNAKKYESVLQEISRLRQEYPQWSPPKQLITLATNGVTQSSISSAVAAGDPAQLIEAAEKHRELFSCTHLDWAWSLAEAYAALDQTEALFGLVAGLIDNCPERDRLASLQKATAWLDPDSWERLAEREFANPRTAGVDREFHRLRYDQDIKQLFAAKQAKDPTEFFQRFARFSTAVEFYQDGNIANLAGWSFLEVGDTGNAAQWFGKGKDWDPADWDAQRGLALCALAERRYADARTLAEAISDGSEGRAEILRNAAIGMAQTAYDQQDYASTLQLLTDSGERTDLPRHVLLMAAWSHLHLGNTAEALAQFQEVHGQQPDEESAQGIFNTLVSSTDTIEQEPFLDDPYLAPLLQGYRADQSFAQKRFLTARDLAPEHYGAAGGVGTQRIAWHGLLRDKSGTNGLSKLEDSVHSLELIWTVTDRSELYLRLDHHHLNSGLFGQEPRLYLARGLLTGALGINDDTPAFAGLAETGADSVQVAGAGTDINLWEPHLIWHNESRFNVEAAIGLSIPGGALEPLLLGHLSLGDSGPWGNYTLTGYARPVRESILSYAGWRLDEFLPGTSFNGETWGAVRALGAEVSAYLSMPNRYGFSGKIGVEQIDGENVRENSHVSLLANLNRGFALEGFDHFAVGIGAGYDEYRHNLSQFTPGHGGYFSPQTFLQIKVNLDFLTIEKRRAILKGHLDVGRIYKHEATTPIIPLPGYSDLGTFPGSRGWGWGYSVELDGAMQVGKHVQLGTQFSYRAAPQYDELTGMLFIRFLFAARESILSSDLTGEVSTAIR
jgi:tetratricopeptide (TPR) repeat protein